MLKKQSNKRVPCTYCEEIAIPNTYPPVCEKHRKVRKKASEQMTLKELETK